MFRRKKKLFCMHGICGYYVVLSGFSSPGSFIFSVLVVYLINLWGRRQDRWWCATVKWIPGIFLSIVEVSCGLRFRNPGKLIFPHKFSIIAIAEKSSTILMTFLHHQSFHINIIVYLFILIVRLIDISMYW